MARSQPGPKKRDRGMAWPCGGKGAWLGPNPASQGGKGAWPGPNPEVGKEGWVGKVGGKACPVLRGWGHSLAPTSHAGAWEGGG